MCRFYGAWFVKEDPGNSMQGATESLLLVGTHWLPPTVPSDGGFLPLKAPLRSGRLLFFPRKDDCRQTVSGAAFIRCLQCQDSARPASYWAMCADQRTATREVLCVTANSLFANMQRG